MVQPLCQNVPLHISLPLHLTKQVARFLHGIFTIPFVVFKTDFFSFQIATKEKKQKNVAELIWILSF
ncbi:MAG: hypothetical protein C0512_05020 [Flavobacterium sp.]|nr:hypothetical protein [Flavobacterium sp.]